MIVEAREALFWSQVSPEPNTGCWLWTGCMTRDGYGRFRYEGKVERAHRLAFFFTHGRWPVPCGLHKCDNPPCCNPDHVFEGTRAENAADMAAKGRAQRVSRPGEFNPNARVSAADVERIKSLREAGWTLEAIGLEFGITKSAVHLIAKGVNWQSTGRHAW